MSEQQELASVTDERLLELIGAERAIGFELLCYRAEIPWCSDGPVPSYTPAARKLSRQLQRLRRANKIFCQSGRWSLVPAEETQFSRRSSLQEGV